MTWRLLTTWQPGIPLYRDPDTREEQECDGVQTIRPIWELVDDLIYERAGLPDEWMRMDSAYHWWPGCDEPWFGWQTVARRQLTTAQRR
jgi:hypothetical protein